MFELASHSTPKPRKNRNGDRAIARETESGTALIVLADGLGGRPCDWKASDVACKTTADTFEETPGTPAERLEASVEAAHRRVGKGTGRCEGMLAALVAVACEPEAEQFFFTGVGDARLYRLPPGEGAPEQLTEDDTTTERVEPDLPGARPYLRKMLTRAVGEPYELNVEVRTAALLRGAGLALASDGAYPLSGFTREARRAFEAGPMQEALSTWLGSGGLSNDDDATVALLRRSRIAPGVRSAYEEALREGTGFREQGLAAHLMIEVAFEETRRGLAEEIPDAVDRGLSAIESGRLRPGRERLLAVVDRIGESDLTGKRSLFDRALTLARKQPF